MQSGLKQEALISIHERNLMMSMFVWFVFVMINSFLAQWFFVTLLARIMWTKSDGSSLITLPQILIRR